jgi:ADP-ribose pyrophosphatase YjhB (NUDIX family)
VISCTFEHGAVATLRHTTADVVALDDEDRVLLVRRARHLDQGGKWALPGGFLDVNEFAVDGARRELLEETGYSTAALTLLAVSSDPKRDARQNVTFFFFCNVTERTAEPDDESEEITWFAFDELPSAAEVAFDHFHVLQLFRSYREGRLVIPHIA